MIEMYVEKQPVDINTGFSTLLTLAIDDVRDFGARTTSFSKTIVLPGTKNNNKLFNHIFEFSSSTQHNPALPNVATNFNAAVSADAIIFSDNIQVFKGVMRLMEVIGEGKTREYEVAVFGELGGFIYDLGNKRLEDLDFSAYDLDYTEANIVGSWDGTPGTGVNFPLVDYGTYSPDKHDWQYRTFRPALFVAEYLSKIFSASRYTYNCALFATDRFKRHIVPFNAKRLTRISSNLLSAYNDSTSVYTEADPGEFFPYYNHFPILGSFVNTGLGYLEYTDPSTSTGNLRFKFTASYYKSYSAPINIQFYKVNGGTSTSFYSQDFGDGVPGDGNIIIDETFPNITFTNGDRLTIFVNTNWGLFDPADQVTLTITDTLVSLTSDTPTLVQINLGEPIVINDTIPRNISQKDFFSSIVKLYNLYVYEDKDVPYQLNITPNPDFYTTDPAQGLDWSLKLDRGQPIRIKPMSELNARFYEFKYKSDSDFYNEQYRKRYNENYGDRIFDTQFEFAQESEKVEIIFSGTPLVGYTGEDKVYSTILKSSAGTEETIDSNIRILQILKVTGIGSWAMKNGASVLGNYTVYGYAGHFDDPDVPTNDLNFGVPKELFYALVTGAINVNQFNVYYSAYMAEITDVDSKLLTGKFYLTRKDIYNLNFAQLIWIDGALFRLNKISDYNANTEDTCTVELLKALHTNYTAG